MPQLSPEQLAPAMVGTETTYGTQPLTAAFTPQTHGFLSILSPNAVAQDFRYQQILPHQTSWTKQKDIPTTALDPVTIQFPIIGGATAAAPPRYTSLLECSGLKKTVAANVAYTPAALADVVSATFAQELPGYVVGAAAKSIVEEVNGMFGSIVFRGTAEGGLIGEFRGVGLHQDPQETSLKTIYGGGTNAWAGGPNNANKFILAGASRIKMNDGATDYFPVCSSFEFDLGVEVTPIPDINSGATFGWFSTLITDRNPRLTLTIALDTDDLSPVSYQDLLQDAQDGTTHLVAAVYTDLAGRTLTFNIPTAQVIGVRKGTGNKIRNVTITYKVQHITPEAEFTMTFA